MLVWWFKMVPFSFWDPTLPWRSSYFLVLTFWPYHITLIIINLSQSCKTLMIPIDHPGAWCPPKHLGALSTQVEAANFFGVPQVSTFFLIFPLTRVIFLRGWKLPQILFLESKINQKKKKNTIWTPVALSTNSKHQIGWEQTSGRPRWVSAYLDDILLHPNLCANLLNSQNSSQHLQSSSKIIWIESSEINTCKTSQKLDYHENHTPSGVFKFVWLRAIVSIKLLQNVWKYYY